MNTEIYIQHDGVSVEHRQLVASAKEIWKEQGKRIKDIKEMKLYVKPAERKCYYIINGETGSFNI